MGGGLEGAWRGMKSQMTKVSNSEGRRAPSTHPRPLDLPLYIPTVLLYKCLAQVFYC